MTGKTFTYDQWLALGPTERDAILRTWNPYAGENIHIPREAGRRYMQRSSLPIVAVHVGIYHGGEYILNPELWPKDRHKAPPWFSEEFEGFRIGFCEHDPRVKWEEGDE